MGVEVGVGLGSSLPGGWQGSLGILLGGVPWALPFPLGWGFLTLGVFFFLCALKTIFALSGVRKKYSDMVEKDIYIPWWAMEEGQLSRWGWGRGGVGWDGGFPSPSHPHSIYY